MRAATGLSLVLSLVGLSVGGAAQAATYNVKVCAELTTDYSTIGGNDDFYTDNSAKPARGVLMTVVSNTGTVAWSGHTTEEGADAGCTSTLSLSSSKSYSVKILAEADIYGNMVEVYDDSTTPAMWASSTQVFTPTASTTKTFSWGPHQAWNILSAAGFALQRRDAGLSGETFTFYTEACAGGGNCYSESSDALFIASDTNKYVIAHEMGHKIASASNGGAGAAFNYTATSTDCPWTSSGHSITSEEYQSAAVNEGIASYYAAAIWNRTDESDCYYTPSYALDWTQDGVGDSSAEFSCESGGYAGVDSYDYMGDYCLAVGAVTNRGTQYDWMRFFWDLETDQGLSVTDIFAIWDEADPDAWTASGAGSGASFPAFELDAAASALGYGAEWSTQLALDPSAGR